MSFEANNTREPPQPQVAFLRPDRIETDEPPHSQPASQPDSQPDRSAAILHAPSFLPSTDPLVRSSNQPAPKKRGSSSRHVTATQPATHRVSPIRTHAHSAQQQTHRKSTHHHQQQQTVIMIDAEAAETLMSLSAPDERKFASPLYAKEMPWHASKKQRAFDSYSSSHNNSSSFASSPPQQSLGLLASSLPSNSSFMQHMSLLRHNIQERPLTSMIPRKEAVSTDDSDEDMDTDPEDMFDNNNKERTWGAYRSPFDGLVAAARDYADDDNNSSFSSKSSSSRPIMIPMHSGRQRQQGSSSSYRSEYSMPPQKSSLSRVKEDSSYMGLESSPTGVEEDSEWFDSYRESSEYKQRARLASICSSDGSEYGGLGRKNFEGFLRMDISERNENDRLENQLEGSSPPDSRYIGSYSPEARRKRIERFLEKRKHRVWSKKVDYDVRKNFANSRLRVKGRFVKKEDEELLCQLLSYT